LSENPIAGRPALRQNACLPAARHDRPVRSKRTPVEEPGTLRSPKNSGPLDCSWPAGRWSAKPYWFFLGSDVDQEWWLQFAGVVRRL